MKLPETKRFLLILKEQRSALKDGVLLTVAHILYMT